MLLVLLLEAFFAELKDEHFSGDRLCKWLQFSAKHVSNNAEAAYVGERLIQRGLIAHLNGDRYFDGLASAEYTFGPRYHLELKMVPTLPTLSNGDLDHVAVLKAIIAGVPILDQCKFIDQLALVFMRERYPRESSSTLKKLLKDLVSANLLEESDGYLRIVDCVDPPSSTHFTLEPVYLERALTILLDNVDLRDRRWHGSIFRQSFVGRDAVFCLVSRGIAWSISHAVEIGNRLLKLGRIQQVHGEMTMRCETVFYRFAAHGAPRKNSLSVPEDTESLRSSLSSNHSASVFLQLPHDLSFDENDLSPTVSESNMSSLFARSESADSFTDWFEIHTPMFAKDRSATPLDDDVEEHLIPELSIDDLIELFQQYPYTLVVSENNPVEGGLHKVTDLQWVTLDIDIQRCVLYWRPVRGCQARRCMSLSDIASMVRSPNVAFRSMHTDSLVRHNCIKLLMIDASLSTTPSDASSSSHADATRVAGMWSSFVSSLSSIWKSSESQATTNNNTTGPITHYLSTILMFPSPKTLLIFESMLKLMSVQAHLLPSPTVSLAAQQWILTNQGDNLKGSMNATLVPTLLSSLQLTSLSRLLHEAEYTPEPMSELSKYAGHATVDFEREARAETLNDMIEFDSFYTALTMIIPTDDLRAALYPRLHGTSRLNPRLSVLDALRHSSVPGLLVQSSVLHKMRCIAEHVARQRPVRRQTARTTLQSLILVSAESMAVGEREMYLLKMERMFAAFCEEGDELREQDERLAKLCEKPSFGLCEAEKRQLVLEDSLTLDITRSHLSLYRYFREFCQQTYCDENLDFVLAVEQYRRLWSESKADEAVALAESIMVDYLNRHSRREINLMGTTATDVKNIATQGTWTTESFDAADNEIRFVIHGILQNFIVSRKAQEWVNSSSEI